MLSLLLTLAIQDGPRPPRLNRLPRVETVSLPKGSMPLIPRPPSYPYGDREALLRDANELSRSLTDYIVFWNKGQQKATLPDAFVPPGVNRKDFPKFTLTDPATEPPAERWTVRPARPVDFRNAFGSFPDPNCTYLVVPAFYAPFGSKLVIEGEFPHARFMSIQVTPSFDPRNYHYDGGIGVGEVPIVDADIEPLPGHVNPFRVGADRQTKTRGYRVEFEMASGDPVRMNPSFRPPYFRASSKKLYGSGIQFQGPWGTKGSNGHGRGAWDVGQIWIRYYLPDSDKGPLGGVPLPNVYCQLSNGSRFWVKADATSFERRVNKGVQVKSDGFLKPDPQKLHGPKNGWYKQTGIFRSIITGIALGTKWAGPEYVRLLDKGVAGRDESLPAPNRYEQSATSCSYIDYLVRGMSIERDHVVVLTGKLPTFPNTYRGTTPFEAAQMRYWSITGYAVPQGFDFLAALDPNNPSGIALQSIRDDEVILDENRRYVIALSKADTRPKNATAECGVTWRDWGPAREISWTLRWLSVGPEWSFAQTPSPQLLGWKGEYSSPNFDPTAISTNGHNGLLGEYLPRIGYLQKRDFEALGTRVRSGKIPVWR